MSLQEKLFSALRTKTSRHRSPASHLKNSSVPKGKRVLENDSRYPVNIQRKTVPQPKQQHNVQANFKFAIILYIKAIKELSTPEANTLISGLGTWLLLSLTAAGACGTTLEELQNALFINDENAENVRGLLERLLDPPDQSVIQIATKILIQDGYDIEEQFRDNAVNNFSSAVDSFNPNEAKKLVQHVNAWVSKKTEGKIGGILPPDFDAEHTRMLLVNAIYFKAAWDSPFDKSLTQDRPFHFPGSKGDEKVWMMNKDTFFTVARPAELSCAIVKLPYKGRTVSLYIFIPNEVDGLTKVEEQLTNLNMEALIFEKERLDFFLPKFKIESDWNLVPILKSIGIKSLFDISSVDLSAIHASRSNPLHVSHVSQRAVMEVDEDGATAAAVTSFSYVDGIRSCPPELVCDHPFMFMVYDSANSLPYFMGRVCNPQSD